MPCLQRMPLPCNNPAPHCFGKARMPIPCHKPQYCIFSLRLQKFSSNLCQSGVQILLSRNEPSQQPAQARQCRTFLLNLHQKCFLPLQPEFPGNGCRSPKCLIVSYPFQLPLSLLFQALPSQSCHSLPSFPGLLSIRNCFQRTISSHTP